MVVCIANYQAPDLSSKGPAMVIKLVEKHWVSSNDDVYITDGIESGITNGVGDDLTWYDGYYQQLHQFFGLRITRLW